MSKYLTALTNKGIDLKRTSGKEYTTCPKCSPYRKAENRKKKCLLVNIDEGDWHCNHCQDHGNVKSGIDYNQRIVRTAAPKQYEKKIDVIPKEIFEKSLSGYDNNNFIQFIAERFGSDKANKIINTYHIGTSKHWGNKGATAFWYIDKWYRVRSGKVMLFDNGSKRCNRVKEPFDHINWTHSILDLKGLNLSLPFFGEHQLTERPNDTVAIVESEKTACIASIFFPADIWIASAGIYGLTDEKIKVLKGRKVELVCDAGLGEYKWSKKLDLVTAVADDVVLNTSIQDIMDRYQIEAGDDLADVLLDPEAFGVRSIWTTEHQNKKND